MEATHPERLNRRLLAERAKLAVQLTEEGEIRSRDSWEHQEQT